MANTKAPSRIAAAPFPSHAWVFLLAILSLSFVAHAQWEININITPTTYFSIQPNMTSLDFGDITGGRTQVFYIQNDGNTVMNVTMSSSEAARVKMFVKTSSDKEDENGPSCEGTFESYVTDAPVILCTNLRYVDSADRLAVAIRLEPLPATPGGSYESSLLITAVSEAGTRQLNLPITYSVKPRAVMISPESENVKAGAQAHATVTDQQGVPLPNSQVAITGPDGSVSKVYTDSKGVAVFETAGTGTYMLNVEGRTGAGSVVAVPADKLASASGGKQAPGQETGIQSLISNTISNAASLSAALSNSANVGIPIALLVIGVFSAAIYFAFGLSKHS
ncbi:MAG: carboxypeptidase-like regulatory domain-containing protein [Candidatus Micrarchaeia archaeon]